MDKKQWYVYLLECRDGSYYTGVTNDMDKRMKMHAKGNGSKYVRQKGFSRLLYCYPCLGKSEACKEEYKIKQLSRCEKIEWFNQNKTCN